MANPALSVVLPARDAAPTIGAQLDAIAGQDVDLDWELVVVDHGSVDGTAEVVERHRSAFPALELVRLDRAGWGSRARNAGMRASRGRWLVSADADDVVQPGWLAAHVEALDAGARLVMGGLVHVSGEPPAPLWATEVEPERPPFLGYLPFADTCNLSMPRTTYEALGGLDETLARAADVDFSWRAQEQGAALTYQPAAVVHKRSPTATRAQFRRELRTGRSEVELYLRHREQGMPRSSAPEVLRTWWWLASRSVLLGRPDLRREWACVAGRSAGRLQASASARALLR